VQGQAPFADTDKIAASFKNGDIIADPASERGSAKSRRRKSRWRPV